MNDLAPGGKRHALDAIRTKSFLLLHKAAKRGKTEKFADMVLDRAWRSASIHDAQTAIRYGNLALRRGEVDEAIEAFSQVVAAEPTDATALYKFGFSLERGKDWAAADIAYQQAQELLPDAGNIAFRRGRCLIELDADEDAIAQFRVAIRNGHKVSDAYAAVYSAESNLPIWKRLETLRAGTPHHLENPKWLEDRAILAAYMGNHEEAIEYFEAADKLSPLTTNRQIDLALSCQHLGLTSRAAELLHDLAANDDGPAKTLGPGAFFQKRGYWSEAISLFRWKLNTAVSLRDRARIEFEIGNAYDRQYLWDQAHDWFSKSLLSDGRIGYRHYRLGLVLERLGSYREALGPYAKALEISPDKTHWYYRMAVSARRAGLDAEALIGFRASLAAEGSDGSSQIVEEDDSTSANQNSVESLISALSSDYSVKLRRKRISTYGAYAEPWRDALQETNDDAGGISRLSNLTELSYRRSHLSRADILEYTDLLLENQESLDNVLDILESTRDVRLPDGLDLNRYLKKPESRRRSLFAEFQENIPIKFDHVFFESNHGSSIGCHPLALFRQMAVDARFKDFTFVWAHKADSKIPEELSSRTDVILVNMHSDLYLKYLASCKYLVNNVSFAPYFLRRKEQIYLNTWHGTPLKTLGRSMRQGLLEYENLARNFVQATHVASPNELTDWALFDDHRISRYATALRRITGSPRLDRLITDGQALRTSLRRTLGVDAEETLVLFAPTWRGGVDEHQFDTARLIDDLSAMAGVSGSKVIFRAHRLTERLISSHQLPVDVVPSEIDTNDLLAAVDVLITDYSSIGVDFLPTGRPVIYYIPDVEEFSSERGLYVSPDEFPGTVCRTRNELVGALDDCAQLPSATNADLASYSPKEDGRASARTIDFMLEPVVSKESSRPLLVFHASLIPNGIASALLALLHALDPERVDVVLVVEGHVMRREEGRQSILHRLPDHVDLAFRVGNVTATPEEQWAINRDNSHDVYSSAEITRLQERAWKREGRRVLGSAIPDAAIEFDGYAILWADLMARIGDQTTRHLIWQHNQLVDEWRTKYPELSGLFTRYDNFDAIVPVADSLAVENHAQLMRAGFNTDTPYVAIPNVLDVDRIAQSANDVMDGDLAEWMDGASVNVLAIGRLSPEKNFTALVESWPVVVRNCPGARLSIVGSGLLEADLKALVEELNIDRSVLLAGQRPNPYPALKRADLFVLPSTHEGQPVVILEAMTLGVPVAAAFTPGTAELLEKGYGALVDHYPTGLAKDLSDLLISPPKASGQFDARKFRTEAYSRFIELAVDGVLLHRGDDRE